MSRLGNAVPSLEEQTNYVVCFDQRGENTIYGTIIDHRKNEMQEAKVQSK